MERERGGSGQLEQTEAPNPAAALTRLIGEARTVEGLDRTVIASRINALLIAMRQPGNEAAEAKAILAELDVSSLDGLIDGHGRDCRKEAVETLLACGFPFALEVDPKDLDHLRKTKPRRLPTPTREPIQPERYRAEAYLTTFAAVAQMAGGIYVLAKMPETPPAMAAVSLVGAVFVALGAKILHVVRKREHLWIPIVVMGIGGLMGFEAAFAGRNSALAIGAMIGGGYLVALLKGRKPEQ